MSTEERLSEVSARLGVGVEDMLTITRSVLDALLHNVKKNAPRATATIEATEHVIEFVPHSLGHLRELDKAMEDGA